MNAGCDCTELCAMGPTCPGGALAGLDGSGCWRTTPHPPTDPNANADEARDCQGEWERDVADSGDLR